MDKIKQITADDFSTKHSLLKIELNILIHVKLMWVTTYVVL